MGYFLGQSFHIPEWVWYQPCKVEFEIPSPKVNIHKLVSNTVKSVFHMVRGLSEPAES